MFPSARLVVHKVGAFVASFVPSLDDFERVDQGQWISAAPPS
jgi:hypothetical protein